MHIIEEIFDTFARNGHLEYGESVTQLEHSLQAAAFAEADGASDTLVAAALLHDYGHLIHGLDEDIADEGLDGMHEAVVADYLAAYFVPAVIEPIRLHVAAKRYLCAVDPVYLNTLTAASLRSLALQGGPFSAADVRAFEASPFFEDAVRLRHFDDRGKIVGMETPSLEHFRPALSRTMILAADPR